MSAIQQAATTVVVGLVALGLATGSVSAQATESVTISNLRVEGKQPRPEYSDSEDDT